MSITMAWNPEELALQIELGEMAQEAVVTEFHDLAQKSPETAIRHYRDFAAQLEHVAHGGNAQIRSLAGGPMTEYRASLIDVLTDQCYTNASHEGRRFILDTLLEPLQRDNIVYVQMTVAEFKSWDVIGDIARVRPIFFPGIWYFTKAYDQQSAVTDAQVLRWLDGSGHNHFAALAVAADPTQDQVVALNYTLFEGAAHIAAAYEDALGQNREKDKIRPYQETILKFRHGFCDSFVNLIEQKAALANWLPLDPS